MGRRLCLDVVVCVSMCVLCRDRSPSAIPSSIGVFVDCGGKRALLCIGACAPRIPNCARSNVCPSAATSAMSACTLPRSCRRSAAPCHHAYTSSRDSNCVGSLQLHTRAVSSSTSDTTVLLRRCGWCLLWFLCAAGVGEHHNGIAAQRWHNVMWPVVAASLAPTHRDATRISACACVFVICTMRPQSMVGGVLCTAGFTVLLVRACCFLCGDRCGREGVGSLTALCVRSGVTTVVGL